jgi:hypothetical protein
MGRLERFLKLERPRPRREEGGPAPAARDRFAQGGPDVPAPPPPAGPRASGAGTDRFVPAPEPAEKTIALLEDDGGQPFIRCRQCRTDNHVTASKCSFCEASLATAPQRAYNEALWAQHSAEKADLHKHVQALEASRRAADEEAFRVIRQNLTYEQYQSSLQPDDVPPLGLRLARRIRDPRLRLAVLIVIGVVPLYLVFFGAGPNARFIGYLMALAVGFLFSPRNLRRWLRGGTWTQRL